MASAIDPTLDGTLDDLNAPVSKPALKTALTTAASEITDLQENGVGPIGSLPPSSLDATNLPADNDVPSFDETTGKFVWVPPADVDLFEVNQRIDAVEERVIPQGTLALAITDGNGQANIASPDNDTLILTPGAGVGDPYTARSVARLATAQYTDILTTASRVLSGSDRTIITSTPEGEASRQLHQRIVARHGSNLATEIVFTIGESLPTGPYLFFRAPDQAGDVSIVLGGAGSLRGVEHNDPALPTVNLMPGQMLCLWVTNYGSYPQVSLMFSSEDRAIPSPTLDGVAPNDVITFERHAGMVVQASGNVEVLGTDIPSGRAFPIAILATASVSVTFNAVATALVAGDMIAAYVYSPTVWKAKKLAAGDFL